MITDTLANLARYRGLHKNLDTAIDWLASHDVSALPNGRTVIDGEAVFVMLSSAHKALLCCIPTGSSTLQPACIWTSSAFAGALSS